MLPMPAWVYSDLERSHYLSFLKSNETLQMLRSIQAQSLEPPKIAALLHVIQNDLGFYLHQSVQAAKVALSAETAARFVFQDYGLRIDSAVGRREFEEWIEDDLQKVRSCIDRLLSRTGIESSDVDRVF